MAATARKTRVPEPRTAEELGRMTREEVLAYVDAGGSLADLVRHAQPVPATGAASIVDADEPPMVLKGIRMPVDMVAELERLAGRDRAGISGLVREAVAAWLVERGAA